MNSLRIYWLDQLKAMAVFIALLIYFIPLLNTTFNPVNINTLSQTLDFQVINFLSFNTTMGLILISTFSLSLVKKPTVSWWVRKIFTLTILSTFLYATGQDYRSIYWQIIQVLGVYFPLIYFLVHQNYWGRIVLGILGIIIYVLSLPWWDNLVSIPLLGPMLSGGMIHQVSFNLLSAIPMVVFSSWLVGYTFKEGLLNSHRLHKSLVVVSGLIILDYLAFKYLLTIPLTQGYPPSFREYLWSIVTVLVGIEIFSLIHLPALANFGQRGILNYWALWLTGTVLVEWNDFGMYQFSQVLSFLIVSVIFIASVGLHQPSKKKVKESS